MQSGLVELTIMAVLAGLSLVCVAMGVRSLGGELRLLKRMDTLSAPSSTSRILAGFTSGASRLLISDGADRREIAENLALAGYYSPHAPLIFAWTRIGVTLLAWGVTAFLITATGHWSGFGPYFPWGAAGMAYLLSKRVLGWSAARRRRKVEKEMPFVLDVLTMMLESGVSLDQSFRIMTQAEGRGAPLIRRSLELLVADIERGMPYETALDRWSAQLGVGGARELASLFKRNLSHGAELSGALAAFAREFSEKRVATARESVGAKSAQMAVVMMIFFMPALFIVLAGPAFVTLMSSLTGIGR